MKIFSEIKSIVELSECEISLIKEILYLRSFTKKEVFLKKGQKNDFIGYLKTGLFRSYYIDQNGNEITTAFIEEDSFFTDLNSFFDNNKSEITINVVFLYIIQPKTASYLITSLII